MKNEINYENNTIKIIDAFTGSGKTTYLFNEINRKVFNQIAESVKYVEQQVKFLYVSPYLTEVGNPDAKNPEDRIGRIHKACEIADFKSPTTTPTKSQSLKRLLTLGENVCCTHALFEGMDSETASLLNQQRYEVIIDEALEVIQPFTGLKNGDRQVIQQFISVDPETHLVSWIDVNIGDSRYDDIKKLCDEDRLYYYRDSFFIWELSPSILTAAKQVTICTYMFQASVLHSYFKKHSIPFDYIDPESIDLKPEKELLKEAKGLIEFVDSSYSKKLSNNAMSATAYDNLTLDDLKIMRITIENLVERSLSDIKSSELLWTSYKAQKKYLKGKGYSRSFLAHNVRATNDYSDRKAGIWLIDKYPHALVNEFLKESGSSINKDLYGLSEMIQWIWRLRIRNGESIKLVIPSKRMRSLLERWLDGEFIHCEDENKMRLVA